MKNKRLFYFTSPGPLTLVNCRHNGKAVCNTHSIPTHRHNMQSCNNLTQLFMYFSYNPF